MTHNRKTIDDYGGHRYGSRYRTKHGDESISSFECDECGKRRFVTARELARAFKPRCTHCGGMLLETEAEAKRRKRDRRSVRTKKVYRCRACGMDLGGFCAQSLVGHLRVKPDCREYMLREGWIFLDPRYDESLIYGTAYVVRERADRWAVHALSVSGMHVIIHREQRKYKAEQYIDRILPIIRGGDGDG